MPEFAATAGTSYLGSVADAFDFLCCVNNWLRLSGCKSNIFKWLHESFKPLGGSPGKGHFLDGVTLKICRNWLRLALSPIFLCRMPTRKRTETAIHFRGFTAFSLVP